MDNAELLAVMTRIEEKLDAFLTALAEDEPEETETSLDGQTMSRARDESKPL
jgi:hypothetical protein